MVKRVDFKLITWVQILALPFAKMSLASYVAFL